MRADRWTGRLSGVTVDLEPDEAAPAAPRRRIAWYVLAALLVIALILLLVRCLGGPSGPIGLAYDSSGWVYTQVDHGAKAGFESRGFDTGGWKTGRAGFGTLDARCPWNVAAKIHTTWDANTDLLMRHTFRATGGKAMHIDGTIDNNADVYVNGLLLAHVENGNCQANGISVDVPAADLRDGDNMIAIRAADLGDADYIDVQVVPAKG
jgi:hypothetical protein